MRKIRELLRLYGLGGLSTRVIGKSCGTSHVTVSRYLKRIEESGIEVSELESMGDVALREFFKSGNVSFHRERPQPDWNYVHR